MRLDEAENGDVSYPRFCSGAGVAAALLGLVAAASAFAHSLPAERTASSHAQAALTSHPQSAKGAIRGVRPEVMTRSRAHAATPTVANGVTRSASGACSSGPTFSKLVWSDDFNGPAGSTTSAPWKIDVGAQGWTNGTLQSYTSNPANVSLDGNGHLALTAIQQTTTGRDGITEPYSSGKVETGPILACPYGEFDARIWLPAGRALWPAFWMVGDDYDRVGWPDSGEIDVVETWGSAPSTAVGTIHGPSLSNPGGYAISHQVTSSSPLSSSWHTYGVIWTPTSITWTLDGVPYGTTQESDLAAGCSWVFQQTFHLILNLAVTDSGGAPAATKFPATMLVDWVHVYQ